MCFSGTTLWNESSLRHVFNHSHHVKCLGKTTKCLAKQNDCEDAGFLLLFILVVHIAETNSRRGLEKAMHDLIGILFK